MSSPDADELQTLAASGEPPPTGTISTGASPNVGKFSEQDWGTSQSAISPVTWDPFFTDYMTIAGLYRYPTQHFRYHQRQLT